MNEFFGGIIMKKTFKINELDCANCAAKMEEQIRKLDGVNSVNISFMTQRITIDANDSNFDEIVSKANVICKRIHRHTEIVLN